MLKHGVAQYFLADHIQRVTQHMQAVGYRRQHLHISTVAARIDIQLFLDILNISTDSHRNCLHQIIIENNHALTGRRIRLTINGLVFQSIGRFYCHNPPGR